MTPTTNRLKKDYIVVKDWETARGMIEDYHGKSLQGKWVIVAPKGLKEVSLEDLLRLPQIQQALTQAQKQGYEKGKKEGIREIIKVWKFALKKSYLYSDDRGNEYYNFSQLEKDLLSHSPKRKEKK